MQPLARPHRLSVCPRLSAFALAFTFVGAACETPPPIRVASPPPLAAARPSAAPSSPPLASASAAPSQVLASASASATPANPPKDAPPRASIRAPTDWDGSDIPYAARDAHAFSARSTVVKELFAAAHVSFPPASLLFRAWKSERELEVWASSSKDEPLSKVATYGICRLSGELGPKRSEGDGQVPEGFYTIHYLWSTSNYHLEMKVGYPNASDKILGTREPGGDIMIHGACASIGCLSMSDERAEELWVMASSVMKAGAKVHVHIFPARDFADLLANKDRERNWDFWRNIKEGLDAFEQTRRLPVVGVDWKGRYTFK